MERQHNLLTSDPPQEIEQMTMTFDSVTGKTIPMRSKADAPDYRYMPDPNLGTIHLTQVGSAKV